MNKKVNIIKNSPSWGLITSNEQCKQMMKIYRHIRRRRLILESLLLATIQLLISHR